MHIRGVQTSALGQALLLAAESRPAERDTGKTASVQQLRTRLGAMSGAAEPKQQHWTCFAFPLLFGRGSQVCARTLPRRCLLLCASLSCGQLNFNRSYRCQYQIRYAIQAAACRHCRKANICLDL